MSTDSYFFPELRRPITDADFRQEMAYWDRELSLEGDYPDAIRKRSIPERMTEEFPHYLARYFDEIKSAAAPQKAKVLDVGSGPLSMLGFGQLTGMFDLTCVDPLAGRYLAMLAKSGHSPTSMLVQGFGEDLVRLFSEDAFDLIWMHNALDHSQSPAKVVRAMARVVRPGGYVVILGWRREGTFEGWIGLHQHDLYLEPEGRLMCQANNGTAVCITEGLPLETVEVSDDVDQPRGWMRVIYRRTNLAVD